MEEQDEAVCSSAGLTIELTRCFPDAFLPLYRCERKVGSDIEGYIEKAEAQIWSIFKPYGLARAQHHSKRPVPACLRRALARHVVTGAGPWGITCFACGLRLLALPIRPYS